MTHKYKIGEVVLVSVLKGLIRTLTFGNATIIKLLPDNEYRLKFHDKRSQDRNKRSSSEDGFAWRETDLLKVSINWRKILK